MTDRPKRGQLFTHPHQLDTDWRPDIAAGERYADAPHAECVVTRVTGLEPVHVYYRHTDGRGRFVSPLSALINSGVTFRDPGAPKGS